MNSAELGQSLERFITRLAALDAALARGLDDAKAGRSKPSEDVFARLQAKYTEHPADARSVLNGAMDYESILFHGA